VQDQNAFDRINRSTYGSKATVRVYERSEGFTDPGEQAALDQVRETAVDRPILDLGVGGGRTIPLLRGISRDYTGIDYTPELVAACRKRFPDANVQQGDARQLSQFADGRFYLVVFSFNGIDSVAHADRTAILSEIHRVLMPGGLCLFSTHNLDGPVRQPHRFSMPKLRLALNPLRLAYRLAHFTKLLIQSANNRRRFRVFDERANDFCMINTGAHDYGLMIHHIRLAAQRQQLRDLGFEDNCVAFSSLDGQRVEATTDTSSIGWFHLVVRKPGA
jgi:SAM-dependent methyltransferase